MPRASQNQSESAPRPWSATWPAPPRTLRPPPLPPPLPLISLDGDQNFCFTTTVDRARLTTLSSDLKIFKFQILSQEACNK